MWQQQKQESNVQFYSVEEVAEMLGVSKRLIYEWVNNDILPSKRLGPSGRLIRIRHQDLMQFVDTDFQREGV